MNKRSYGVVRAGGVVVVGDVVVAGGVVVVGVVVRSTVVGALNVFRIDEPPNIQTNPAITRTAMRPGMR